MFPLFSTVLDLCKLYFFYKQTLKKDTLNLYTQNSWSSESKREKLLTVMNFVYDSLWSPKGNVVLHELNCENCIKFLDLVNCLSDLHSVNCMLSWRASSQAPRIGLHTNDGSKCWCPTWLKIILNAFPFLKIISAFLQLQKARTTSTILEEARWTRFGNLE